MERNKKAKHFIQKPTIEGGMKAIRAHVKKHLRYPPLAIQNKIEGTVRLKYDINYKGKVIGAKVVTGIGYGCDEEAIRIVKLLQFKVKKSRKIKVIFHKTISIHFKINQKQEKPAMQIEYTQPTATAKANADPIDKQDSSKGSYHYTISW